MWKKKAKQNVKGLGVEENLLVQNLEIYPNPVKDILFIEVEEGSVQVQIFSTTGILIRTTSNRTIDVSDLASGLYFAKVLSQGRNSTKRFIKI